MREHRITAIPDDGIGPEVIGAGLEVLEALAAREGAFRFQVEQFPWSSAYYLAHGHYIPEDGLERLKQFGRHLFLCEATLHKCSPQPWLKGILVHGLQQVRNKFGVRSCISTSM
jgi:isocitrate/isopropylmalate dehydrogenase